MRDVKFEGNQGNTNVTDNSKKSKKSKKTKITISIGSAVIVVGLIIFLFNLNQSIEKEILGTWHNNEISDLYLVFSEGNSLTVNRSGIAMNGTYIFVDDNRIQLNFNFTLLNYVIYADVSVQSKTLRFDNIEDLSEYFFVSDETTFTKIK